MKSLCISKTRPVFTFEQLKKYNKIDLLAECGTSNSPPPSSNPNPFSSNEPDAYYAFPKIQICPELQGLLNSENNDKSHNKEYMNYREVLLKNIYTKKCNTTDEESLKNRQSQTTKTKSKNNTQINTTTSLPFSGVSPFEAMGQLFFQQMMCTCMGNMANMGGIGGQMKPQSVSDRSAVQDTNNCKLMDELIDEDKKEFIDEFSISRPHNFKYKCDQLLTSQNSQPCQPGLPCQPYQPTLPSQNLQSSLPSPNLQPHLPPLSPQHLNLIEQSGKSQPTSFPPPSTHENANKEGNNDTSGTSKPKEETAIEHSLCNTVNDCQDLLLSLLNEKLARDESFLEEICHQLLSYSCSESHLSSPQPVLCENSSQADNV